MSKILVGFKRWFVLSIFFLTLYMLLGTNFGFSQTKVSLHASYTASCQAAPSYPDTDGKEMTDGVMATESFKDAAWQGRQSVAEYSQIFDLQYFCYITSVSSRFLESTGSAIYQPKSVSFSCSNDGVTFVPMGNSTYKTISSKIGSYEINLQNALRTRYIKMTVVTNGEWTFSDEFSIMGISDAPRNIAQTKAYQLDVAADTNYRDSNMRELTDGIFATSNFHDTAWQGHLGNYSITVDLGTVMRTTSAKLSFLEYSGGGISFPTSVHCYGSTDNISYLPIGDAFADNSTNSTKKYVAQWDTPENIRYIRFDIESPTSNDWIFQDEIEVMGYPIVSGSFIQLSYGDIWTQSDWSRELAEMKDLGMDHVILQWIVDRSPSEPAVYYNSSIYNTSSGYLNRNEEDLLMNVLTAAEALDMDVWIGLAANEEWWDKGTNETWLTQEAVANTAIIKEIWDSPQGYKNKSSLKGWYSVWEIENYRFKQRADQSKLRAALKTIVDFAHSYTGKPIMTSPYIGGYSTGLQPDGWRDMWIYLLDSAQGACFDVVAPQDNFGNITETYLKAMKQAVDTNLSCEMWSNVETYLNPDVYAEPTITLMKQVNEEIKYVKKMTSFSYLHYSSSDVVGWAESEDWKRVVYPRLGREYIGPVMGYENKAAGKPYTTSIAAHASSPDTGGTELTNKKYAGAVNYLQDPYQIRQSNLPYEVVIDLQKPTEFISLQFNFIKQAEYNVDLPQNIAYYGSLDGKNYELLGNIDAPVLKRAAYAFKYRLDIPTPVMCRYVKAVVTTGSNSWTACDELEIIGEYKG